MLTLDRLGSRIRGVLFSAPTMVIIKSIKARMVTTCCNLLSLQLDVVVGEKGGEVVVETQYYRAMATKPLWDKWTLTL